MIFLCFLLPLVQIALCSHHEHRIAANVDAKLPSLIRHKRDLVDYICPRSIAKGNDLGRKSFIIFRSPANKKDVKITYRNGGWTDEAMATLIQNGFNTSKPTIIYSHGYHQTGEQTWLKNARKIYDEISASSAGPHYNMLIFDWSSYSNMRYWTAVSYVPHLGNMLAQFIEKLGNSQSYDMDKLHLIGYSLSTHIVGLASRAVKANHAPIGQLTALDPTGVCMHTETDFADKYSLRPTDAKFVVARHYNMEEYGARRPIGGLDIFINGGKKQPMAPGEQSSRSRFTRDTTSADEESNMAVMARPDHHRATEHETQTLTEQCHDIAYECTSYEAYLRGECADCGPDGGKCYLVSNFERILLEAKGEILALSSGYAPGTKMFLRTHYQDQFCMHHYQVIAVLNTNAPDFTKKLLSDGLVGFDFKDGQSVKLQGPPGETNFTALASLTNKLEHLNSMTLKVIADNSAHENFLNSLDHMKINYMSHYSPEERVKASFRLCLNQEKTSLIKCN